MGDQEFSWAELFLREIERVHVRLEQVLDVLNCRECWLQVELYLAMRQHDPTFAINRYCYSGARRNCKADFSSENGGGMIAELKLLGNGYLSKCFDGTGRLERFQPEAPGGRVIITSEQLDAATGYFLHDCARLRSAKGVSERYMILIVDRREPMDTLGSALIAAQLSAEELSWTAPSGSYIARVWRI